MKKRTSSFLAVLLALSMVLALCGCTGITESAFKLNATEASVFIGDTYALTATLDGAAPSGTVTWRSSDKAVADVSDSGVVTGVSAGTATITAEMLQGAKLHSATCVVTVTADTSKLFTLSWQTKGDDGGITDDVTATFYSSGTIKVEGMIGVGYNFSFDIPYKVENGALVSETVSATVEATDPDYLAFIGLIGLPAKMEVTDIQAVLTANILKIDGKLGEDVRTFGTYELSEENAAALGITLADAVPVESVSLDQTELAVKVGDVRLLKATLNPDTATIKDMTFASSDANIVSVDATGKVEAKAPGTATITVTTLDGSKTASCEVTVAAAPEGTKLSRGYVSEDGASYVTLHFTAEGVIVEGSYMGLEIVLNTTYTMGDDAIPAEVSSVDWTNAFGTYTVSFTIEKAEGLFGIKLNATNQADTTQVVALGEIYFFNTEFEWAASGSGTSLTYSVTSDDGSVSDSTTLTFGSDGTMTVKGYVASGYNVEFTMNYAVADGVLSVETLAETKVVATDPSFIAIMQMIGLPAELPVTDVTATLEGNILTIVGTTDANNPGSQVLGIYTVDADTAATLGITLN